MASPEEITLPPSGTISHPTALGLYSFELPEDLVSGTVQIKNKYGRVRHTFTNGGEDEDHEIVLLINDTETSIVSNGLSGSVTLVVKKA